MVRAQLDSRCTMPLGARLLAGMQCWARYGGAPVHNIATIALHHCLTTQVHTPAPTCPSQLVGKLMAGATLPIPPRDQLPGPDTAAFTGLDTYIQLHKRCCSQAAAERPPLEEVVRALRELLDPLVAGNSLASQVEQ